MKVSVIIPIYKVEAYIRRCAVSLMRQTMQADVEFIFVNDGSPCRSVKIVEEVVEEHPHRKAQVKIINHKGNRGLAAARNTGLAVATGDYIYHCDSDDWLEPDMLRQLYVKAVDADADFVWCDWYLAFAGGRRYMKQASCATAHDALLATLGGALKYNVWNKLVKRRLYADNGIRFPEGHDLGEDMTTIRLLACAERVGYVLRALYNYAKHEGEALTNAWSERSVADMLYNANLTVEFVSQHPFDGWQEAVAWFQLSVKRPFLICNDNRLYALWQVHFVEAHRCIWRNPYASLRSKLLMQAATWRQYWLVRLHYVLLYKFFYGVIYK